MSEEVEVGVSLREVLESPPEGVEVAGNTEGGDDLEDWLINTCTS